ncbi:MAG TPA: hypothetical protein VK390_16395 [Propionibacteriaceae bacterium]|nr:hypothetical protein [Propionibacteriaceae bacterium]
MTKITYTNPRAARPDVGALGPATAERAEDSRKIRQAATIPLVISLGAQWVFFIHYWIPETSAFPANELWLTQLSPLASAALTSEGQPQVQAQNGQWGLPALVLLVCAFALFWLSRTRHWLGRTAMLAPAALGLVAALASVITLGVKGELRSTIVGVALLITWVWSAGYAALHGFLDNLAPVPPKTWHSGLPVLAAYAIIGPAPTAVGRWLFAPELRDAALALQHNTVALRLAALWTPSTVLLYLCGLLIGVAVWVAYQAWPPRRDSGFIGRCMIVIGILIVTGAIGWPATALADKRVQQLTYDSPVEEVRFTCGSWILDQPTTVTPQREPVKTLVISGFTCQTVTAYSGYQQLSTHTLPVSLSPVVAYTPDGVKISGRIVAAQYGDVIVVAGSDRFDTGADELLGIGVTDSAELWRYACGQGLMGVRFANVPGGDNPAEGRITQGEVAPEVVVSCEGQIVRINPTTGPPR